MGVSGPHGTVPPVTFCASLNPAFRPMQYIARLVGGLRAHVMPLTSRTGLNDDVDTEPGPDTFTRARPIGGGSVTPSAWSTGQPTVPPATRPGAASAADALPRLPSGVIHTVPVRFEGHAREYAWLWWRCAALVLLTAGLALPCARAMTRRWLLRHTWVAGHALDLAAPARAACLRDLLGVGLVAGVVGALAGESTWAGAAAIALASAAAPVWLHLRLADDPGRLTWGGRRLVFKGTLAALYRAVGPALAGLGLLSAGALALASTQARVVWLIWGGLAAVTLAGLPAVWARWVAYRQQHLALGPLALTWRGGHTAFWALGLRVLTWGALVLAGVAGVLCMGWALLVTWTPWQPGPAAHRVLLGSWLALSAALVWPFLQARLHHLAWNHTGCRHLRFRSTLAVGPYVRRCARHTLLTVLSAGVYRPWASVDAWRLRTEALAVRSRVDPGVLAAHWSPDARGAADGR